MKFIYGFDINKDDSLYMSYKGCAVNRKKVLSKQVPCMR